MPLRFTRQPVIPAKGTDLNPRAAEFADARNVKRGFQYVTEDSIPVIYDGAGNRTYFVDTVVLGNKTITLPSADASVGLEFTVKHTVVVGTVTVIALSGQIEGSATYSIATMIPVSFKSDGTNYWTV